MNIGKTKGKKNRSYDVIIIGGGAAGMSAALWCDELGLSALLLESSGELGGQLLWTYNPIENHLGIKAKNGRELRDIFSEQIENRKFDLVFNSKITNVDLPNKKITLAGGETFSSKSIIIATGVRRRRLGIEGEKEFENKGILHSGKRDRDLVKNKNVVIVGGGDAAIENALILAETASKVTVIHRRKEFRAREEFLEEARKNSKISLLTKKIPTRILGTETITQIEIKNLESDKLSTLPIDAVLLRIGVEPNTEMFSKEKLLDENGYIKVNAGCQTSIEGIYAIGDVANPIAPTVSSAVGMGATAVKSIIDILRKQRLLNEFR